MRREEMVAAKLPDGQKTVRAYSCGKFLLLALLFTAPIQLRAVTITGGDYAGGNLIPNNGDVLSGTFLNVGLFQVPTGNTAFVAAGVTLIVYASTISINGTLDGSGRGQSGGSGGAV